MYLVGIENSVRCSFPENQVIVDAQQGYYFAAFGTFEDSGVGESAEVAAEMFAEAECASVLVGSFVVSLILTAMVEIPGAKEQKRH